MASPRGGRLAATPTKKVDKKYMQKDLICKFFQIGECRNGNACRFRHILDPDRAVADMTDMLSSATLTETPKKNSRRKPKDKLEGKNALASPPVQLDGTPPPPSPQPRYLVRRSDWKGLPDWIQLTKERGDAKPFPPLASDVLFSDGPALLLPFAPPEGAARGRGAAIVCPGGNLEFLHPREGYPIARWLAEALGIPAFVLRYRLLPEHGLEEMIDDFTSAVRHARSHAHGGPVVAFGFSAGGYVCAAGSAAAGGEGSSPARPDGLALVYPCTNPDGWLKDDECGFHRAECDSAEVQSLIEGRERLCAGAAFVPPPPLFVCASTTDEICPPESETDPYVAAAKAAGTPVTYLKGDFGDHGWGLKRFWAEDCMKWLRELGVGAEREEADPAEPTVRRVLSEEAPP